MINFVLRVEDTAYVIPPFFSTYRFLLRSHSFQISEKIPLPLLYTLNRGLLFKITPIISFRLISHPQFHSSHVVNDNVTDDNKFICRSFFFMCPRFFLPIERPCIEICKKYLHKVTILTSIT